MFFCVQPELTAAIIITDRWDGGRWGRKGGREGVGSVGFGSLGGEWGVGSVGGERRRRELPSQSQLPGPCRCRQADHQIRTSFAKSSEHLSLKIVKQEIANKLSTVVMDAFKDLIETDSVSRCIISALVGGAVGSFIAYVKAAKSAAATAAAAAIRNAEALDQTLVSHVINTLSRAGKVAFSMTVKPMDGDFFETRESLALATKALWSALAFLLTVSAVFTILALVSRKRRYEIRRQREERERKALETERLQRSWSRRALSLFATSSWRKGRRSTTLVGSTSL